MSKLILITGGSVGIGRATCLELSKKGYIIVFSYYKDKEEAEKTKIECEKNGAQAYYFYLNLLEDESIKKFATEVIGKFGKIDILINNAGVIYWKDLKDQTFEEITNQVRVNLEGLIKIAKIFLPYINEMIINVSSGAGKTAYAGLTTYCATKFGVRGFTQALAKELNKIKVFSLNPDMTQTRMTNFSGRPPQDVAKVILDLIEGRIKANSGDDIDVWRYL
ncbi:MAG: SDR family NAD(P)-dependent oxidoreductase [Brevinematia bacterium]